MEFGFLSIDDLGFLLRYGAERLRYHLKKMSPLILLKIIDYVAQK